LHPKPIESLVEDSQSKMRKLFDTCGLLCFSEEADNLLLWAHYAKFYTGICLRFVVDPKLDFYQDLHKVRYSENIPFVDFLDYEGESLLEVFKTKAKIWEYEKEWRIIRPEVISNGGRYFVETVPEELIDRIILGSQISRENQKDVVDWAGQRKIEVVTHPPDVHSPQ